MKTLANGKVYIMFFSGLHKKLIFYLTCAININIDQKQANCGRSEVIVEKSPVKAENRQMIWNNTSKIYKQQ